MKTPWLGLVCAGSVSRTSWVRLPGLAQYLGPVKSSSLRAASRAVNNLKTGTPVGTNEEIAECQTILFSVPEADLEPYIVGVVKAREDWTKRSLILFRCAPNLPALDRFQACGGSLCWFDSLPGSQDKRFVAEGDPRALKALRKLVQKNGVELIEIARGTRAHFQAATAGLTCLHLPLLAASMELLRKCDLPGAQASELADQLLLRSSRSYLRSGKRALSNADLPLDFELELQEAVLKVVYERQLELTREWLISAPKIPQTAKYKRY